MYYLQYLNWLYVGLWIAGFLVISGGLFYLNKTRSRWRKWLNPILVVILIRLIFFYNIGSWAFYYTVLDASDVGFRQIAAINYKIKRFLVFPEEETKYLAVGSSQTGAVYGRYSKKAKNFMTFYMPGMGAPDMYLYRNEIADLKPEHILLYLCEFDLARQVDLNLAKISPDQGFHLFFLYKDLKKIAEKYDSEQALKELLVGEVLIEYKYAYIFKGLTNKAFTVFKKKKKNSAEDNNPLKLNTDLQDHIKGLKAKLNQDDIALNIEFLKRFLSFCRQRNIKVTIIEGQYHPEAYDSHTLGLNRIVKKELASVSQQYSNVTFIPREDLIIFTADDYVDAYHVTGPNRDLFLEDVLSRTGMQ